MKIIDRIKRDKKMIVFLATPVKDDNGGYLKDSKDRYVYPTLVDASKEYKMFPEHISRIRSRNRPAFDKLKADIIGLIESNQELPAGES